MFPFGYVCALRRAVFWLHVELVGATSSEGCLYLQTVWLESNVKEILGPMAKTF